MPKRWRRLVKIFFLAFSAGSLTGCADILSNGILGFIMPPSNQVQPAYGVPQPEYAVPLYGAPYESPPPQVKYGVPWSGTEPFTLLPGSDALAQALSNPTGLAIRSDGTIGLSDSGKCVFLINETASEATASLLVSPSDLAADTNGWILADGNQILRLQAGTATVLADSFNAPQGVAVASGSIVVADTGNHQLKRLDSEGNVTVLAGESQVQSPNALAIADDGTIYFCDTHAVKKWKDGIVETVAGGTLGFSGDGGPAKDARLNTPRGLALDAANRLFVADTGNHRVRVIDLETGEIASLNADASPSWDGTFQYFDALKDLVFRNNALYVLDGKRLWRAKP
ncbi:MAG: NHL repeat-containing protein [Bacteroidota bacterium]